MSQPHPPAPLTDSRLAALCAEEARQALGDYENRFDAITRRARERFLARDWPGTQDDATERLHLYSEVLDGLTTRVKELMGDRLREPKLWSATKAVYSSFIARSIRWEVGESFFNSLTRRVFATEGVDQAIEFVDTDFDAPPHGQDAELCCVYNGATWPDLLAKALTADFAVECWKDLPQAAGAAAERIQTAIPSAGTVTLEIFRGVFYRGRGAYLVGRITEDGETTPVAFCLRHPDELGIELDAVLIGEGDLAILFSYTRAYFRVDAPATYALVQWLRELMPGKRVADLYNAIGYNRHAKTEFYRDFVRHLEDSNDCFVAAEGTRGMVMLVFTLPSYDVVFKLIRDRFDAPKESDRRDVMGRYRMVFEHDRAGRLVEAHEFEHLRIARDRFEPSLLAGLTRDAGETVKLDGDDVVIAHAYVERRVRPLNLLFRECDEATAIHAACDYAQSIKDLAASNIFAGDLLTKNFGLTRRGRVVFYDYDELAPLTDCNFRELPQSRSYEEEMAAEPWFSVRPNDIFPEEFLNFLSFPEPARVALLERHGDLFRPEYWRGVQEELRAGELPEILPYAEERRLRFGVPTS
ncbi:MAG: bifunctional isocitrate dehydrogenase kinase/phosphatase [Verrucomicrobiota bacterium]|nr:bifunctional isocitrate dehydrogenase kinase/phosphatase [Verrucomicrobiota bacterium]MDQ3546034.1 bifunctional isocitrate dehydrogenase kinase/phosphatase [Verrucomicrobiota bacterium]